MKARGDSLRCSRNPGVQLAKGSALDIPCPERDEWAEDDHGSPKSTNSRYYPGAATVAGRGR